GLSSRAALGAGRAVRLCHQADNRMRASQERFQGRLSKQARAHHDETHGWLSLVQSGGISSGGGGGGTSSGGGVGEPFLSIASDCCFRMRSSSAVAGISPFS